MERLTLRYYEKKMKHAIIFTYVRNKIGFKLNWFGDGTLLEMKKIFHPEISLARFLWLIFRHKIPVSRENLRLLVLASVPKSILPHFVRIETLRYGVHDWHWDMSAWPIDQAEGTEQ